MKEFKKNSLYRYRYYSEDIDYSMLMIYAGETRSRNKFIIVQVLDIIKGSAKQYQAGDIFEYNSDVGKMIGINKEDFYVHVTDGVGSDYSHYISHIGTKVEYPEYFL